MKSKIVILVMLLVVSACGKTPVETDTPAAPPAPPLIPKTVIQKPVDLSKRKLSFDEKRVVLTFINRTQVLPLGLASDYRDANNFKAIAELNKESRMLFDDMIKKCEIPLVKYSEERNKGNIEAGLVIAKNKDNEILGFGCPVKFQQKNKNTTTYEIVSENLMQLASVNQTAQDALISSMDFQSQLRYSKVNRLQVENTIGQKTSDGITKIFSQVTDEQKYESLDWGVLSLQIRHEILSIKDEKTVFQNESYSLYQAKFPFAEVVIQVYRETGLTKVYLNGELLPDYQGLLLN
jgi:hypothetical protein